MKKFWIALGIFLFVVLPLLVYTGRYQKPIRVISPGYSTEISFKLDDNGRPLYSVFLGKKPIIVDSPMGIEFRQGGLLSQDLRRKDFKRRGSDEEYHIFAGKARRSRNRFNEITVTLKEAVKPNRQIEIVLRAYDDGVAFRYQIPKQKIFMPTEIVAEWSCFRFPANFRCWIRRIDHWGSPYERIYEQVLLDDIRQESLIALPMIIETDEHSVAAILESDVSGYPGMCLAGLGGSAHTLVSKLPPHPDSAGICLASQAPLRTPWRVILLGRSTIDLIESNTVIGLARESKLDETDWIKPGLMLYPWWSDYKTETSIGRLAFESLKYYVDFASEKNIPYVEVGPSWYGLESTAGTKSDSLDILKPDPKIRLPELARYAKEKSVGLFLRAHWKSIGKQADSIFSVFEQWGIAGVTVDSLDRNDQVEIEWLEEALETAARHHLMIASLGSTMAPGLARTWPNLVSSDAVAGNECNKWDDRITPQHNVTLPFTRMLAGAMDFAPGGFENVSSENFVPDNRSPKVMTTRCQQIAMFVVYESPLQRICDWPGAYRNEPHFDFIASMPTSWDETKVLFGEIGEYVAIARRSGNDWYLGAMTNPSPRSLVIPLTFLGRNRYEAEILRDGPGVNENPKEVAKSFQLVTGSDTLEIALAGGGGAAAKFVRRK